MRRRHRHQEAADLDVTPFMNLMIVLVPVLLLSMVFTHTTVIDLNFPSGDAGGEFDPDNIHLEVQVRDDRLMIADGRGGTIKTLPKAGTDYDYVQLSRVMQEIKKRMPEKRDITILLEEETHYQTLVRIMDGVRSYPTMENEELVQAELFPVISLGDTPVSPSGAPAAGSLAENASSAPGGQS